MNQVKIGDMRLDYKRKLESETKPVQETWGSKGNFEVDSDDGYEKTSVVPYNGNGRMPKFQFIDTPSQSEDESEDPTPRKRKCIEAVPEFEGEDEDENESEQGEGEESEKEEEYKIVPLSKGSLNIIASQLSDAECGRIEITKKDVYRTLENVQSEVYLDKVWKEDPDYKDIMNPEVIEILRRIVISAKRGTMILDKHLLVTIIRRCNNAF